MEKQYSTSHQMGNLPNFFIVLLLSIFPLLGVFLFFFAFYVPYYDCVFEGGTIAAFEIGTFIFNILLAISAFMIGWTLIKICLARYRFEDIGLAIKYPLEKEIIVPWEDFQQICVCYDAYTPNVPRRTSTAICCVKKARLKTLFGGGKQTTFFDTAL